MIQAKTAGADSPFLLIGGIIDLDPHRFIYLGKKAHPFEMCIRDRHALARYADIARFCGLAGKDDQESFANLCAKIEELKETVGIKKTIKDYDIDEKYFLDTLDEMVERAFDDQCTGANPRYPLMSEIKDIYLKCYYGK